jgi:hypothetical protein
MAPDEPVDPIEPESATDGVLDKMRDTGVGTEDPNIVGDVGPTDIPPGADPPEEPAPEP